MATQLRPPIPRQKPAAERFEGFVECVDGDVAYISLESEQGERLQGPYPADELIAKGVGERDRFRLTLTDEGDAVRFDLQLIPRRTVSAERQAEIQRGIEQALSGYPEGDDY